MVADSRLDAARSPPSLPGVRQRDPLWLQRGNVVLDVKVAHLDLAAVDNVDDVFDGDRGLGNVCGYYYFSHSPRRSGEDRLLAHLNQTEGRF